jgi:hypothetical protein
MEMPVDPLPPRTTDPIRPYWLTENDRTFLRSLRILPEDDGPTD